MKHPDVCTICFQEDDHGNASILFCSYVSKYTTMAMLQYYFVPASTIIKLCSDGSLGHKMHHLEATYVPASTIISICPGSSLVGPHEQDIFLWKQILLSVGSKFERREQRTLEAQFHVTPKQILPVQSTFFMLENKNIRILSCKQSFYHRNKILLIRGRTNLRWK